MTSFGLLNWNSKATFRNTYYKETGGAFNPLLTDISVTSSVGTVEEKTQFTSTEPITLQYQWYYYDASSSSRLKASSSTAATLSAEFKAYRNNQQYRCRITDAQGDTLTTNTVKLVAMEADLVITSQPVNYVGSVNDNVSFTVEATGTDLTYQWYRSDDNGASRVKTYLSGYNIDTLSFAANASRAVLYKCVIIDAGGNTAETNTVSVTIGG